MSKVRARCGLAVGVALVTLLAGCGGGGGGGGSAPPPTPPAPPPPNPGGNVTVSGAVTFDFVPAVAGQGLAYGQTTPKPARGVTVELISGATVLASATTDTGGAYSFSVAQSTIVTIRARAEMVRAGSPSWNFRVVDNTNGDALYVLEGTASSTGTSDSTRNLHAASGWGGSSYTATRSAAPFAILDTVYDATQFVLTADPVTIFPALVVHWSPNNKPTPGSNGGPDPVTGDLGTSFFAPGIGIFLVGAENVDTDEYDRHVIIHEWGHYFEHTFSRSDSIGGPHTRGDQLDFRVAFGEGWGNALSAMVTGQSVYRDVSGPQQSQGFGFDVEGPLPGNPNPNQGWYSEESIQEILYDLFDNSTLDAAQDGLSLGFGPIHSVLTNHQRTSVGLTSIFPFISALKANQPAEVPFIDNLVNGQSIGTIAIGDDYGTAETNHGDPPSSDLTSVYSTLTVNSGTAVNVCSLDVYTSSFTDSKNKLGSRRFLKFTANAAGSHTITATATAPINAAADPDMVLHQRGRIAQSSDAPDPVLCTQATPPGCRESFSPALTPGDYVLEVFEWTNTNSHDDPDADFRPIGRTCFDVEVTQP